MPAIYTHDRFGQDLLTRLDGSVQELLEVERSAFDTGLQGPDFLFYYKPLLPNQLNKIGSHAHAMSGRRFFNRCLRIQRANPDDANLAYLLGCMCHFLLDSRLHPMINARCDAGDVTHSQIEMALDRNLMLEDGLDPFTVALGANLDNDDVDYIASGISRFYPPLNADQVAEGIRGMHGFQKLLLMPNEAKRKTFEGILALMGPMGKDFSGHIMSKEPIAELEETVEELKRAYEETLDLCPKMIEAFLLAVFSKKTLPKEFDLTFNGDLTFR